MKLANATVRRPRSASSTSHRIAQRSLIAFAAAVVLIAGCTETGPSDPGTSSTLFSAYYDRIPGIGTCDEGVLKSAEKQKVLARLNSLRSTHGLPAVTYNNANDVPAQRAAEICAANNVLNHTPPTTFACWSSQGAYGCSTSNLAYQSFSSSGSASITLPASDIFIDQWLIDEGNPQLGHRRWLLNPFLHDVSFGRVDQKLSETSYRTYAAIKVLDTLYTPAPTTAGVETIAFPQGDYPSALVHKDWYMSCSLLIDKTDFWKNQSVDYAGASVTVEDGAGHPLAVHSLAFDNIAFGLANNIQWIVDGLQDGTQYTVTIRGAVVNGTPHAPIQYSFRLVA